MPWVQSDGYGSFAWLPDSSAVVHSAGRSGLVAENASSATSIPSVRGSIGQIDIAADGRIAFERGGDLWVAAADGRGSRRILRAGNRFAAAGSPSWSPDGSLIAFDWLRCPAKTLDIYVIRPDGTGLRRLTGRGDRRVWFRRHWSTSPAFSPDGRSIAFSRAVMHAEVVPCQIP